MRASTRRSSSPSRSTFKIQANMDPAHRDRVAFMRVCSGRFTRNMAVKHARLNKEVKLSKPLNFQDPGEYGSCPSRPRGLHARLFRAFHAQYGGEACAPQQGGQALQAAQLF